MAPNLNSAKNAFVFLGKSVFILLETMIFTLISKPRKSVAGEIVLITGAGSGIGRLLALMFARLGAVLVLWDINQDRNEETCSMARDAGATRACAYTCDCSRREDVYRVAHQVKKEVGDVSILINNASIVTGKKFLDCPDELMEKSLDVNFKAHLWTYKAFLPAMIANAHGHLVCISSSAGLIGVNGMADVEFNVNGLSKLCPTRSHFVAWICSFVYPGLNIPFLPSNSLLPSSLIPQKNWKSLQGHKGPILHLMEMTGI
ncbi:PREDICTED: epidermal retinol dehydrogenase 2 isoform X1 [Miniopterus natalensis]|uniref:epidermal retinol dehydrogenase 2 isoform X1 n=1 Tax=Miniopterus natalensis TaxID=291302 RepID=UPI0007A6E5F2|nr:PREDICTED: epidermal retinol dehydrogenase 2 isoform X1 [Miniopterus natalensis]